jgi:hemoglobin
MSLASKSLYERLGGYDSIAAVVGNFLPRCQADPLLERFWLHRGADGIQREKQLLIDYLCASAGGPLFYGGRDMLVAHRGMRISNADWTALLRHLNATLDAFSVPRQERGEVVAFVESTRREIVEA